MHESSNYSSDLQRKFAEACQLTSDEELAEYLSRECPSEGERELCLRLLAARTGPSPLLAASEKLKQLHGTLEEFGEKQSFRPREQQEFPEIPTYEIRAVLGEGAMGTVYDAEQQSPVRRRVALKVIKPGMGTPEILARFEREKQALASLKHPHICNVFDAGVTAGGDPYFSMERIVGESLDGYCRQKGLGIAARVSLLIDLCRAVHYAHGQGVIHRDLKPTNVLVETVDERPLVKVIDFGIAKVVDGDVGESAVRDYVAGVMGTPLYMSPEQLAALEPRISATLPAHASAPENNSRPVQSVGVRSDVYSLGGLLYRLVSGYAPRETVEPADDVPSEPGKPLWLASPMTPSSKIMVAAQRSVENLEDRLGIPSEQWQAWRLVVKGSLESIIMKALAEDPERRYASAQALGEALQQYLQELSSSVELPLRKVKRWHFNTAVLGCGLIALVLGGWWLPSSPEEAGIETMALAESASAGEATVDFGPVHRLQSQVGAFYDRDLSQLRDLRLPTSTSVGRRDNLAGVEPTVAQPSLQRFVDALAEYQPVWELNNGAAIHDFSVSSDARFLVVACEDRYARIWDLTLGSIVHELGPHAGAVNAVVFSADDSALATGDQEGVVTIWDAAGLDPLSERVELPILYRSPEGETGIETLEFSPAGDRLASAHRYGPIIVRTLQGDKVLVVEPSQLPSRNESVHFSNAGQHVLLVNRQQARIEEWDIDTGELVWSSSTLEARRVGDYPRQFTVVGDQIVAANVDDAAFASIDIATGEFGSELPLRLGRTIGFAISPKHQRFATAHLQGLITLGEIRRFPEANRDWELHSSWICQVHQGDGLETTKVEFLDESRLLTAGSDGRVCLWDVDELVAESYGELNGPMRTQLVNSGGVFQFDVGPTNMLLHKSLWNDRGELTTSRFDLFAGDFSLQAFEGDIFVAHRSINVDVQGESIVHASASSIHWRELRTGSVIEWKHEMSPPIHISTDSTFPYVAAASADKVNAWCIENGIARRLWSVDWEQSASEVLRPQLCDSGRSFASCVYQAVQIVDGSTGRPLESYKTQGAQSYQFSPSERLIAITDSARIRVFDRTRKQCVLDVKTSLAKQAQFVDREQILLAGVANHSIQGWHIPTRTPLGPLFTAPAGWEIGDFRLTNDSQLAVAIFDRYDRQRWRILRLGRGRQS